MTDVEEARLLRAIDALLECIDLVAEEDPVSQFEDCEVDGDQEHEGGRLSKIMSEIVLEACHLGRLTTSTFGINVMMKKTSCATLHTPNMSAWFILTARFLYSSEESSREAVPAMLSVKYPLCVVLGCCKMPPSCCEGTNARSGGRRKNLNDMCEAGAAGGDQECLE